MVRLSAEAVGTVPIRNRIMSARPFCPSSPPLKKLTRLQVRISKPRIHKGGGLLPSGSLYSAGILIVALRIVSNRNAALKPISGEISRVSPILVAWLQSTPLVPEGLAAISWFISPTPMMDPISVCELEEGRPKYHVPKFHRMAAISSANTMAKPAPLPTCSINSTGNSDTMPKATAPVETRTPEKLQNPDHTTARLGDSEFV